MRKERLFRFLTISAVCSMAFLCACGKKKEDTIISTQNIAGETDTDHVYNLENIELPIEEKYYINSMGKGKDYFFLVANTLAGENSENKLFKVDLKTGVVSEVPFELDKNVHLDNLTCDNKDNVYILKAEYAIEDGEEAKDTSEEVEPEGEEAETDTTEEVETDGEEETENETSEASDTSEEKKNAAIMKLSSEGELIWEAPLTEEDAKNYVQSAAYMKDKGIITCADGNFSLYDENTGEGKVIKKNENTDQYFYGNLFASKEGDVYLASDEWSDDSSYCIKKCDPATLEFGEEIPLPSGVYINSIYPGESYDFYYEDYAKIVGFNLGDEEPTTICDYTASDILSSYMNYICEAPDGKFYIVNHDDNGETALGCMTKVDASDVEDREVITLGVVYIPDYVRTQVVKFNKKSEKYKIQIIDYGENSTADTEDSYNEMLKKLGLDITQGRGPDMLVVDYGMPVESYVEKGAFEPLDSYFENDPEVNVQDFLENVMDSTRFNDKIYTILPLYGIDTCVASKDVVGDQTITLANYENICKDNNMDPKLGMGYMTREMANSLYSTIGNTFIDYENCTCNFDSEEFVSFLKFVKQLAKDDEDLGHDYEEFETFYREKKSLLYEYYITSFEDYQILKKGYFGTDVEFNGFPTGDGGVSFIRPFIRLAMNHDSKNKEAVWEFMRSFMLDDFQNNVEWGLPVKKSALEALAAKAQEKPYYIDENGQKVESSSVWGVGGIDVEITELSKEETQQVVDFIESVTANINNEDQINNIISEEAGAFYEDQKSAEEVADIIQSRVSLYLNENM